jgi:hypothetical protein
MKNIHYPDGCEKYHLFYFYFKLNKCMHEKPFLNHLHMQKNYDTGRSRGAESHLLRLYYDQGRNLCYTIYNHCPGKAGTARPLYSIIVVIRARKAS